jgi:hypothetical protein
MSLLSEIINGDHDDDLQSIQDACRERKKLNRSKDTALAMSTLKVGDVIVLKGLNPKYINGCQGKITEKRRTKFTVRLDDGQHTGRFGKTVVVPATCMNKV